MRLDTDGVFGGQSWPAGPVDDLPWEDAGVAFGCGPTPDGGLAGWWRPLGELRRSWPVPRLDGPVPVGELWATQRRVLRRHLEAIGGLRRPGSGRVTVVRWDGRLWLWDGHHRAAIARHIGATALDATTFDLQAAAGRATDRDEEMAG